MAAAVRALMALAAFLLVQAAAFGAIQSAGGLRDVAATLTTGSALQLGIVQLAGVLAASLIVVRALPGWRCVGLGRVSARGGWRQLAPAGLLIIGPTMGYALVQGTPLIHSSITPGLAALLVLLALVIAVNEEIWFRGIVITVLGGRAHPWRAVAGSALVFGLPHVGADAASMLNAAAVTLAVGVPFAVVRLRCGSLIAPIGWHAVIDVWAFLHTASVVPEGSPSTGEAAASLVVPLVLAGAYVRWLHRSTVADGDT